MSKIFWETAGSVLRGSMHIKYNEPCQDKIFHMTSDGITAIALSDGAGRAALSHYGASRAVNLACRKIIRDFHRMIHNYDGISVKKNFLEYLRNKLSLLAGKLECRHADLYSTLIIAAADDKNYIIIHTGDGVAGIFTDRKVYAVSETYNGKALNEADFITSEYALRNTRLIRGSLDGKISVKGFVLMSDGADRSYYDPRRKILVPYVNDIISVCFSRDENSREKFLLNELKESSLQSYTTDDSSMIIMNRK